MSSKNPKASSLELRIDSVLSGISGVIPAGTTLGVGGTSYSSDDLVKVLQSYKDTLQKIRDAHVLLAKLVADGQAQKPVIRGFLADVHAALIGVLGRQSPALAKLGFSLPQQRKPLTGEQRVRKAAKAKLTREMRNTLGPKQKEAIRATGEPTVVLDASGVKITPEADGKAAGATSSGAGGTPPVVAPDSKSDAAAPPSGSASK